MHALKLALAALLSISVAPQSPPAAHQVVLRAARLLDVRSGRMISPAVITISGDRIQSIGGQPAPGAQIIDLRDTTLVPGLIDAHVHLFLHPGAEDLQTVRESVPARTLMAAVAARDDLMAGFTAERDMGTEGAGSADTAVRDAIDSGQLPGPRMRISGNAISILGGHEEAIGFNPAIPILPNATMVTGTTELIAAMRQQFKEGADFIKIYETGADRYADGRLSTNYQFSEPELRAAVEEAARLGSRVAVHATGEPGTLYAARAGVASIDHAYQLSPETMRVMVQKGIYAVPTFTISEYFAAHGETPAAGQLERDMLDYHAREFRKQLAAGVKIAMGSDVGPFPHGTQAREFELMVNYGMTPLQAIQAGTINAADLLGWGDRIGALEPGKQADVVGLLGDPLTDIRALQHVTFVMKAGIVYRHP